MKTVVAFSDGACSGNPGPGGCAAVLVYAEHRRELSQGFRWTTNNRMELQAVILALRALKYRCIVQLHTDSKYVMDAFREGWLQRWKKNGWKTRARTVVQNIDLWKELDSEMAKHECHFTWVKGHSGNSENNRCDILAVAAAKGPVLRVDTEYEKDNPRPPEAEAANHSVGQCGSPATDAG